MGKKRGGQPNNVNAIKHGKYSDRDFLTCSVCVAKSHCNYYPTNAKKVCVLERKLEKPDLSNFENLLDFLKDLLTTDYLRFQRAVAFERLSGGMLDAEALKLEMHMRNVIFTIAKVVELSELERRVASLEARIGKE
jgi:hypothetical protein